MKGGKKYVKSFLFFYSALTSHLPDEFALLNSKSTEMRSEERSKRSRDIKARAD